MNFGYILRFAAISVGVGLGTAVGCGGANSSDLLDSTGPGSGGDGGGNPPGQDGGGGGDSGQGRDTGTDASEPPDSGPQSRGVRCYDNSPERYCSGGQPLCCISTNFLGSKTYACGQAAGCPNSDQFPARCDSNDDCPRQGQRCCGHLTGSGSDQHFDRISCEQERCDSDSLQVCTTDADCRGSEQCTGIDSENRIYRYCR
ncbi:hypothetical protein LZC95_44650 [Pendulispora brunnea]|uniref:Uncharacterized protein n=1 Tax=Pendulispora brunnea TaxID=2905690 RepID=A0ABZ2KAX5_9BACT